MAAFNNIVVKIGTTSLTFESGKLNLRRIDLLARAITDLRGRGLSVTLVSSGAIAVGAERLGLAERPRDIRGKQAASAVGQSALVQIYDRFFSDYGQRVAQVLLTKDVFESEKRRECAKDTLTALLSMGVVPIVNENDAVAVDEIEFSDNDALSSYVAQLIGADLLIILSDIDGVYDKNPKEHEDAVRLSVIENAESAQVVAGGSKGKLGTGGMATKLAAAGACQSAGIAAAIANGDNPAVIIDIIDGKEAGTFFPKKRRLETGD